MDTKSRLKVKGCPSAPQIIIIIMERSNGQTVGRQSMQFAKPSEIAGGNARLVCNSKWKVRHQRRAAAMVCDKQTIERFERQIGYLRWEISRWWDWYSRSDYSNKVTVGES